MGMPSTVRRVEYCGETFEFDASVLTRYGFAKAVAQGSPRMYGFIEELFCGRDEEYAERLTAIGAPTSDGGGEASALALLLQACSEEAGLGNS